ncbi:hypothetical protein, unknown function [Leishmania mexicana MHOM/GT/2001/U1103]|uniref:Uncharacterized protein n=1 Tax=Leishmania mexicana (strain MHOM/GT/2001/U1103) TaxID=929439 RepID=E9APP4_LEIMU|nr:hypothetical protein, unknown function [Leishmania mexicana MHOM/GT/2001/U1103]CBZ24910.1 hypothetical protein, unknown function [Leishmania mexicana MHOM/GT/2001/U1103]
MVTAMHQRVKLRGVEEAVIPFSVAHSSPSTVHRSSACEGDPAGDEEPHAEPLYLSLQQGGRVRVLRRECHHGTGPQGASSHMLAAAPGGAALSQPQWCIAQREDGAIGLAPGSLLRRVPGALFSACLDPAAVVMHSDRLQGPSSLKPPTATRRGHHSTLEAREKATLRGAEEIRPTQTPSPKSGSRWCDMADEDDEVADALQLQGRRQSSLQERLNAFCDASSAIMSTHGEPHTTDTAISCPLAAHGTETASDSKCSEKDERRRLMKEEARVRAELHWLTDDLAPRLQVACTEAQVALEKLQQDGRRTNAVGSSASSDRSADSPNPLAALDREHERVAGLLEKVEALQTELDREASADAVGKPQKSHLSHGHDATASSIDAGPPGPLEARHSRHDEVTTPDLKAADPYMVETLRLLVAEEMETVDSYRSQKLALQQRLSRLDELIEEVAAEEASLRKSETALHELLDGRTSEPVVDFAWPRTLQGLTDEEDTALSASVHMFDKYKRKLQVITGGSQSSSSTNAPSSSADVSLLANTSTASSATAAAEATERSGLTATTCAGTPNRHTHSNGRASMCDGDSAVTTPTSSRVEHLRQVLKKGDRELAHLQAKLKAAQEYCDTYGPIARELDEQLQRGERVLAERKKYLADLQAAENGEALRSDC